MLVLLKSAQVCLINLNYRPEKLTGIVSPCLPYPVSKEPSGFLAHSKIVSFPDTVKEVDIIRLRRSRLITPAGEAWNSWFESAGVADDFMNEREHPENQGREEF